MVAVGGNTVVSTESRDYTRRTSIWNISAAACNVKWSPHSPFFAIVSR